MKNELVWVTDAHYLEDYKIRLKFNDASQGVVDLRKIAETNPLFAELQNIEKFRNFRLDGWTLTWLNGSLDIAPESLYQSLQK